MALKLFVLVVCLVGLTQAWNKEMEGRLLQHDMKEAALISQISPFANFRFISWGENFKICLLFSKSCEQRIRNILNDVCAK